MTDSAAARDAIAGLPRLDILVNNAGVNRPQPFLEVDEATLDRMIALNVQGRLCRGPGGGAADGRGRQRGRRGVIINMSSQMGHVGSERDRTVYVMTKHAIEGLTKAMAVELAPKGVRVVSIAPTFVMTPLTKPFLRRPRHPQMDRSTASPWAASARSRRSRNAVVFLASPAASLVTGSSLLVDGGWTAW